MISPKVLAEKLKDKKVRRWLWVAVAAVVAFQTYYVKEMLAALILFAVLFAITATVVAVLYALDLAGQRAAEWAEPQAVKTAHVVAKTWTQVDDVRKKLLHHQHSEIAQ